MAAVGVCSRSPPFALVTAAVDILAVTAAVAYRLDSATVSPAIAALLLGALGLGALAVLLPPALTVASIPDTRAVDT